MLLRLLVYLGLGIDALGRREWLLALLCFLTPSVGKLGMGTAIVAGAIFLASAQYAEGGIAIGVVAFNLVMNTLLRTPKPYDLEGSTAAYEQGLRLIQVTLFTVLTTKYAQTLDSETANTLAAQVVNYLKGEDIEYITQHSDEPMEVQHLQNPFSNSRLRSKGYDGGQGHLRSDCGGPSNESGSKLLAERGLVFHKR